MSTDCLSVVVVVLSGLALNSDKQGAKERTKWPASSVSQTRVDIGSSGGFEVNFVQAVVNGGTEEGGRNSLRRGGFF